MRVNVAVASRQPGTNHPPPRKKTAPTAKGEHKTLIKPKRAIHPTGILDSITGALQSAGQSLVSSAQSQGTAIVANATQQAGSDVSNAANVAAGSTGGAAVAPTDDGIGIGTITVGGGLIAAILAWKFL